MTSVRVLFQDGYDSTVCGLVPSLNNTEKGVEKEGSRKERNFVHDCLDGFLEGL